MKSSGLARADECGRRPATTGDGARELARCIATDFRNLQKFDAAVLFERAFRYSKDGEDPPRAIQLLSRNRL